MAAGLRAGSLVHAVGLIVYTTWSDEELGSVRVIAADGGTRSVKAEPG
jgi:hypothetical protein